MIIFNYFPRQLTFTKERGGGWQIVFPRGKRSHDLLLATYLSQDDSQILKQLKKRNNRSYRYAIMNS